MSDAASPQLEDGYTRIANELLEALAMAKLTARQWAVLAVILRKTYGFNKKVDDMGLSQLAAATGIAKPHVSVALRELEARNIINRKVGQFGHLIGVNKNHKSWLWVTESVTVTDSVTVTESVQRGHRIGNEGVTESVTTKDNLTKDNQKTVSEPEANDTIGEVIGYLNERACRNFRMSKSNIKFVAARLKAGATVEQCKAVIDAKVAQWANDPKMAEYLRPETLFNETKFESYLGSLTLDGQGVPQRKKPELVL